jgi:hypothetical protein
VVEVVLAGQVLKLTPAEVQAVCFLRQLRRRGDLDRPGLFFYMISGDAAVDDDPGI